MSDDPSPRPGCLFGVGTGPGDPELMTLKAARRIDESPVVAHFCRREGGGKARAIAAGRLRADHEVLPLMYPVTTELPHDSREYRERIEAFFDESAQRLAEHLAAGRDVAVLNEGDPFFYGSFMHVYLRLKDRFPTEVIPGVPSPMAAAAQLPTPLIMRDDVLAVIPGTLPEDDLRQALVDADAAVIMKVGTRRDQIIRILHELERVDGAWYVAQASMEGESVVPLTEAPAKAPYFAMIVVPGRGVRR